MDWKHMDYEHEMKALEYMLDNMVADFALGHLRQLSLIQLNEFSDALDKLAALVDAEAIDRIHRPREADMQS